MSYKFYWTINFFEFEIEFETDISSLWGLTANEIEFTYWGELNKSYDVLLKYLQFCFLKRSNRTNSLKINLTSSKGANFKCKS